MNFFEHQDKARRMTGRLVVLFVLAVLAIVAMAYVAVAVFVVWYGWDPGAGTRGLSAIWHPHLLLAVGLGTVAVVSAGSFYKVSQLRGGGQVIALGMGGRLLDPATTEAHERKILNVVEEMAIASGTPVPPVYLMDEAGINAFAAGFSPSDAVIGVTRGCVELLDRDELQGVMAHEFSHILNGDMMLNIRLIGVVHGILVIGLVGYFVIRSALYSGGTSRRSDRKGNPLPLILLGVALILIGYLGVFFGKLIKSAVSRQREFLADASAVQFTRYPGGIAGALGKIGGYEFGSNLTSPRVEENSHMFFGSAISSLFGWMATHPPLPERIGRIDPAWDGQFPTVELPQRIVEKAKAKQQHLSRQEAFGAVLTGAVVTAGVEAAGTAGSMAGSAGSGGGSSSGPVSSTLAERIAEARRREAGSNPDAESTVSAVEQIGQPSTAHLAYASDLVERLPTQIKTAAHEAFGARAVVYALLLDEKDEPRKTQLEHLEQHADEAVYAETLKLQPLISDLDRNARLPLLDMTLPALRELSPGQYAAFKRNMVELIDADNEVDLFEWTLGRIILRHLEPNFESVKRTAVQYYNLRPLKRHCAALLGTLAYAGHQDRDQARDVFRQSCKHLGLRDLPIPEPQACGLDALSEALDVLEHACPPQKRKLVEAAAACISADRQVSATEGELFRAICDSLDCPMPPLLPGQPLV